MKVTKNKRGVIEQLQSLVVPLVGIGIVLIVGFLIISQAKTIVVKNTGVSTTYTKESVTGWTSGVYKALSYSGNCMAGTLTCSQVLNGTTTTTLPTTMYNCSEGGIQITNASADKLDTIVNVTYSCSNTTIAWNATGTVQNAMADIPGWIPVIIITIIGALLLGLVAMFRGR